MFHAIRPTTNDYCIANNKRVIMPPSENRKRYGLGSLYIMRIPTAAFPMMSFIGRLPR